MGEGECAGEVTRGLPPGMGMGTEPATWGELWAMAGESKPNWMPALEPPTGPPLAAKLLGPLATMVTELFLVWSEADPLLPRATAGTAGVTAGLPFTGDGEAPLAFCTGAEAPPATTGGWELVATRGA